MEKVFEVLAALSDGKTHSGAVLAARFGIGRGAVWSRVKRLQALGADIAAVPGKGYQLVPAFEFLSAARITEQLAPEVRAALGALQVCAVVDSTNQRLLDAAQSSDIHGEAWLAEFQTAGRGRRGDRWLAVPGACICLSLGWRFNVPPRDLGALSLVVGVAVARALQGLGARGLALKWPNDVLYAGRKLAGILIEMRSELGGPCTVVIGIGVNVALGPEVQAKIDQPTASLADACVAVPARNRIAAALLASLFETLQGFATNGFGAFMPAWQTLDALAGQAVEVTLPGRMVHGIARGVDINGLLQIEHDGRVEAFLAGHVRLRGAS